MKQMSKNILLVILGGLISFGMNVAAEVVVSSGAVTYSNAATNATTVTGALDELFSAVDINNKIGDMNKISGIGDSTIAGAISAVNTNVGSVNSSVSKLNSDLTSLNSTTNSIRNALGNVSFLPFAINGNSSRVIPRNGTEVWIFVTRGIITAAEVIMIDTWNAVAKNSVNDVIDVVINADGTITLTNNYAGMVRCLAIYSTP